MQKNNIENTNEVEDTNVESEEEALESVKEIGTSIDKEFKSNIQFITIIGEVEGHTISNADKKTTKYEHIIPLLINAQLDPKIEGILIILNTVGGDVEAGLALSEMINSMKKPTISLVLGGGHSIGVPLATSADYSFIVPTATMTIHPIRTTGLIIGVPQSFQYLQKMQQRINNFIANTSRINMEKLTELMFATDELANDVGTILVGESAVEIGLIDEVGGLSAALAKLDKLIESKLNR